MIKMKRALAIVLALIIGLYNVSIVVFADIGMEPLKCNVTVNVVGEGSYASPPLSNNTTSGGYVGVVGETSYSTQINIGDTVSLSAFNIPNYKVKKVEANGVTVWEENVNDIEFYERIYTGEAPYGKYIDNFESMITSTISNYEIIGDTTFTVYIEPVQKYNLNTDPGYGGNITIKAKEVVNANPDTIVSPGVFVEGTEVIVNATPNLGYKFVRWDINGENFTYPERFIEITKDTTVTAYFEPVGIKVFVDDVRVNFPDAQPFVSENGRVMIPIRFVNQDLGGTVYWDSTTETATIDRIAFEGQPNEQKIRVEMRSGAYEFKVNGVSYSMDAYVQGVAGNRLVIPGAYIAQPYPDVHYEVRDNGTDVEAYYYVEKENQFPNPSTKYDTPLPKIIPEQIIDFDEPIGDLVDFSGLCTLTTVASPVEGGITYGEATFEKGAYVSFFATPNEGYTFEKWLIDGVEDFNQYTSLILDRDITAIAYFKPTDKSKLTVAKEPITLGHVAMYYNGDWTNDVEGSVMDLNTGSNVILDANSEGVKFIKWVLNGVEYFDPWLSITLNSDSTATVYFEEIEKPKLNINKSPANLGYIDLLNETTMVMSYSVEGSEMTFDKGTYLSLTAQKTEGARFVKWEVNGVEYFDTYIQIEMDADTIVTAYFEEEEAAKGTVTIRYIDEEGNEIVPSDTIEYTKGEHKVTNKIIDGYIGIEPTSYDNIEVEAGENTTVEFIYRAIKGELTVRFKDKDTGNKIADDEIITDIPLGVFDYTVNKIVEGFKLVGEKVRSITVSASNYIQTLDIFYKKDIKIEPTPKQTQTPEPSHESKPEPIKTPEPSPEPTPEPIEAPVPSSEPVPEPIETPEPSPEPTTEPIQTPEHKQDSKTGHENKPISTTENTEKPVQIVGKVNGKVAFSDGKPLSNARLELHSDPLVTYTDENGYFEFVNVPVGNHKIYLADENYSDKLVLVKEIKIDIGAHRNVIDGKQVVDSIYNTNMIEAGIIEITELNTEETVTFSIELKEDQIIVEAPISELQETIEELPESDKPKEEKGFPTVPVAISTSSGIIAVVLLFLKRKNVSIINISDNNVIAKKRVLAKKKIKIQLKDEINLIGIANIKLVLNSSIVSKLSDCVIEIFNKDDIVATIELSKITGHNLAIELKDYLK